MALRRRARPVRRAISAALAVVGAVVTGLASAGATTLVYEPFDYADETTLGETPATGQNLTGDYEPLGPAAQQKLTVKSPGLDYGSLVGAPTPAGNRITDTMGVTAAGATVSVDQDVTVSPGESVFWSALLTLDDSQNGNHLANITLTDDTTGDELFFGETAVGVRAVRVAANTAATAGLVADSADNAFTDGQTLFLVGRYVNAAATDADSVDLIGYDTAGATTLPASFDPSDPNAAFAFAISGLDIDLVRISEITFTIRGLDDNVIDELRIGSTYGSVVPEPGTGVLVLLGLVGIGATARSRPRP